MTLHIDTDLLIGDQLEKGQETREKILNPRTGALILELPEASTEGAKAANPNELVIDVQRDGTVALAGRVLAKGELESALAAAAREDRRIAVTIRGDRYVHHEDVVAVLDACGLAGLTNLSIATLEPR